LKVGMTMRVLLNQRHCSRIYSPRELLPTR
jgi:hypothetical protein